jgi:flagellum-specific peptidoglycan hydrolase FlgJ
VALPSGQNVNIVVIAHDIATSVDTTLATLSNQSVSALAAGGTKQFVASVSRAAGLPADSYEIEATIAPVQALAESNTNNNTATTPAHTVTSTAPFVDLSGVFGTTWTLPATIAAGKALTGYASVVVKNGGNVALPAGQNVNIVIVAHDTTNTNNPDITLITLANQSVSALAAGGTKQFNAYVNRPAGLTADNYQIEATITPVQALTESNTSNNTVLLNTLGNPLGITVS